MRHPGLKARVKRVTNYNSSVLAGQGGMRRVHCCVASVLVTTSLLSQATSMTVIYSTLSEARLALVAKQSAAHEYACF